MKSSHGGHRHAGDRCALIQGTSQDENPYYTTGGSPPTGGVQYEHISGVWGHMSGWLHTHNVSESCWTDETIAQIYSRSANAHSIHADAQAPLSTTAASTSWQSLPSWARILVVIGMSKSPGLRASAAHLPCSPLHAMAGYSCARCTPHAITCCHLHTLMRS